VARTKDRFNRVVDIDGAGSTNATIRNLARATIEFANHVKHGGTPTRRKAGLAADAVISLANVLRRLAILSDRPSCRGCAAGRVAWWR